MAPPKLADCVAERTLVNDALEFVSLELVGHPHVPLPEATIDQLQEIVTNVKSDLMEVHKKILLLNPADLADHQKEYFRLLKEATSLHSQLHGIKITFVAAAAPPPPHAPGKQQDFRLPRIDLPTFDGSITHWVSFRDMFVTAVDSNASLSKAQKLTYLKSRVTGEALRQINSIIICDANYDVAWNLLNNRYHSERELFFSSMQRFLSQSTVSQPSSSSIRSIVDGAKECISALEKIALPSNPTSEAIIMFHTTTKLDFKSKELWEQSLPNSKLPELKELYEFLESRARSLAATESSSSSKPTSSSSTSKYGHGKADDNKHHVRVHHAQSATTCKYCQKDNHPLFRCQSFGSLSPSARHEFVKKSSLCYNCLGHGHSTKQCSNSGSCRTCHQRHHTMIHLMKDSPPTAADPTPAPVVSNHIQQRIEVPQALVATALVRVNDESGTPHFCRALLDGGSTASFISEECVQRLSLPRWKTSTEIRGLSSSPLAPCKGQTTINIRPHFQSSSTINVNPLILNQVTYKLPSSECNPTRWPHLQNLQLADPQFSTPAKVDLLLGSEVFWSLLQEGKMTGPSGTPIAINSTLGWLVAGAINKPSSSVHVHYAETDLDKSVQRFWELEQVPTAPTMTQEEELSETHFATTHRREPDGRITVTLPLRTDASSLGESRATAIRMLHALERRFAREPERFEEYKEFMKEYEDLGHMELVPEEEVENPTSHTCYIPHHWVLKEESTTTKFRVVFNASSKTSSGISLNDILLVGPTIQDTLVDIITRFRRHKIGLTADVAKMYRQVLVCPAQRDLQRIVWRESPALPIRTYRLLTVTYGTGWAPFLATRSLQQLAKDVETKYPEAAKAITNDFYVDDGVTGAPSTQEAVNLQQTLQLTLQQGQMELRKWRSNDPAVLEQIPPHLRETKDVCSLDLDTTTKALGLLWKTKVDCFQFKILRSFDFSTITKRTVLSFTAKLFDPLGWMAPVIIADKCFIQSLWKLTLTWDAALPDSKAEEWRTFVSTLGSIMSISIPRCFSPEPAAKFILYGFSDASERAYAAAVYLAAIHPSSTVISYVASKTRVAPAKQVSLTRLELCSAHLLSALLSSLKKTIHLDISEVHAFSDSTITLAWISSPSSRWKTFVANRVAEIQRNIPETPWHHVRCEDNPADCASRGISADELVSHPLWWHGPSWLSDFHLQKQTTTSPADSQQMDEELKKEERLVVSAHFAREKKDDPLTALTKKIPAWSPLRRICGWIIRYLHNLRPLTIEPLLTTNRRTGSLTTDELGDAERRIIIATQHDHFHDDIKVLLTSNHLHRQSKLLPLNPFIDKEGLLRVGGRLKNASVPYNTKHPIILPRHSELTIAIINSTHHYNLHSGPQLTLATLNQRFWIVRGRDAVRHQLSKCLTCHRFRAKTQEQLMGDLPSVRVTPGRAFLRCGVDYAGPFSIRPITRGKTQIKTYICLIVCLTTRAIHLELVSALSTDAFLAALRRFVSRRGLPLEMWSDCGTNFVGAEKELKILLTQSNHNNKLADHLSNHGVQWHFNPPGAPHFGGIWEAGVKSVKHHLRRVLSSTLLTFEELSTVLCQVESCLNSRPICATSSSPEDLDALTPGHFLIGEPLNALPDPNLLDIPTNRVSRWQLLQRLQQEFWKRWSSEHLTRLQQRPKWMKVRDNLQSGDLVLIKEETTPPQQWRLGRILMTHPGRDGLVRVATIKTATGEIKRPITKLSLLPIDNPSVETGSSRPAECLVPN